MDKLKVSVLTEMNQLPKGTTRVGMHQVSEAVKSKETGIRNWLPGVSASGNGELLLYVDSVLVLQNEKYLLYDNIHSVNTIIVYT